MKKKQESEFDRDVRKAIESDPEYAAEYFEELMSRPLPVQVALLRKFLGLTQEDLAKAIGMKQTHVSRLERIDSDHLLSLYQRVAGKLGAHLAIVPEAMALVPKTQMKRFVGAHL